MRYQVVATGDTPAYIIYLIDASGSMEETMPSTSKRKIDVVSDLLEEIAREMFKRSRRGRAISNRYKIALYLYGNTVEADTGDAFIPVSEFVEKIPVFGALNRARTNTKAAFERACALLQRTLPKMEHSPAPMICHITDGKYTEAFGDPTSIVKETMAMGNPDGNVLVQNVYIGKEHLLASPVENVNTWKGIGSAAELHDQDYARALYTMSSKFPPTYANALQLQGYNIAPGTAMLFPTENVEMIRMAFVASGATGMSGYERGSEEGNSISGEEG